MSDGSIIIDTSLDTSGVEKGTEKVKKSLKDTEKEFKNSTKEAVKFEREMERLKQQLGGEVPEATKEAYSKMYEFRQEIRKTSRQFGSYSPEVQKVRNALNEYILGLDDTTFKQVYMRSELGLTDAQLTQQANSIKLNARMIKLMGSQTEHLTKQMEGLASKGIKPKDMLPASTLGQFKMLNETIQASQNPIYKLSAGYRALGTSMEQTIKGWTAQKMAVKLAGDDMVKYGLLLRGITAGQASLAMAFPLVGIGAVMAYGAIFSSAIQANEGLQQLIGTVKGKLGQAFKPLLDISGQFLTVVLNMVGRIADLMIKFNELHPTIAKIISVIALLTPAMTLLLLPLNMGIGLLAGWKVAINAAWTAVGGIASAVGLAASTFLVFATVIGAAVGGLIYFYKTNETFRNTVNSAWDSMSSKGEEVFGGLAKYFTETLPNAFKQGGFEGLATTIGSSISNIASTITTKAPELLLSGGVIIKNFLLGVQNNLPQILTAGAQIITNVIQGISTTLPLIIEKMNETRLAILNAIASNLPQIMQIGVQIITLLLQGIAQALPILTDIGIQIITAIIDTITTNLPTIIDTGVTVLTTLLDGIIQALPVLIDAGIQVLSSLVDAITENLPLIIDAALSIIDTLVQAIIKLLPDIIDAGIEILVALIEGISKAIPQLVNMLPRIIGAVVTVISDNLPQIIEAGIKILVAVIEGLIQALPQLIAMLPQIISTITSIIIQNLPLLINAGIQLLVAIITGLIQAIPQLVAAIPQIITAIKDAFSNVDWGSIGKNIINGIGQGLENAKNTLLTKASNLASSITSKIKSALDIHSPSRVMRDEVGKNIALGIAKGIELETKSVVSSIEKLSVAAYNEGIAKADTYKELGKEYIDNLKEGVENRKTLLLNAFKKTVDDGVATFVSENKDSESEYKTAGDNLVKAYTEAITNGTNEALTEISDNITSITEEFQESYDDLISQREELQKKLSGFGDMFEIDEDGDVHLENIKKQTQAITDYSDLLTRLKEKGVSADFLSEIEELDVEEGTKVIEKLLKLDDDDFKAYTSAWEEKQRKAKELAEGFYAEQLTTLDTNFNQKIDEALASVPTTMQDIGKNAMQGFMNGMDSQLSDLIEKSGDIAESVLETFTDAFDIHSPSRVFRDLIGKNIVKGIGVGVDLETPNLEANVDSNITDLVSKLQSTVGYETAKTTAIIAASANKSAGVGTSSVTNNNDNGINVNIENFNGTDETNVTELAQEIAFLSKRKPN